MSFRIRKAGIADFGRLKAIKSEFYLWECERDDRCDPAYAKKGLGARLARNLRQKKTAFFIAEQGKEIVGYVGGELQKNPAFVRYRSRGHLFNLYVKPGYQRRGIGKALFKTALAWFKENKAQDLMLTVYTHNKVAHGIYKKFGFKDYIMEMKR